MTTILKNLEGRILSKNGIYYKFVRKQGVWVFLLEIGKNEVSSKTFIEFTRLNFDIEHPEEKSKLQLFYPLNHE